MLDKRLNKLLFLLIISFLWNSDLTAQQQRNLTITVISDSTQPRIVFGVEKLLKALRDVGYIVKREYRLPLAASSTTTLVVATINDEWFKKAAIRFSIDTSKKIGKEGFLIQEAKKNVIVLAGGDPSGVLYGCLELVNQIKKDKKIPPHLSVIDQPEMVMRGACIGMQKSNYLPGRNVYEYPYTPENFPWFYNKKMWIQYLDSLVENRMNSLYLWNGHPFASLVRLKDYPYAVEVDDSTFIKNEEIYRFITAEADKRGIWVIQMFYNIIVSKPFAAYHSLKTQERERPIIPLIADYTRKSIAAFVEKYPNVGLMVCLGEAMEGIGNDDIEWFTKTIIPGVKDGLKALNKTEEPPIVLRAHDTDAPGVMKAALPLYKNLYTEAKFNGEALTTPRPRGAWAALHQTLSHLGSVQIENVHILANLEPFRYGSVDFIQQSVKGMHEVMGGNGLHLYPQASYWDWPYSADSVKGKRLLQIERDWIWYKAWSRYAWKVNRDRKEEIIYWSGLLAAKYGCKLEAGKNMLTAYEQSGEIAPKLLRRFGITDGNRQTLTLGMLMTQLINPYRYGLFTLLYDSESPEGEMLVQYAAKEWKGVQHVGETPVQIINDVKKHAIVAVRAIELAAKSVTINKDEFERLKNDIYCYQALAEHFAYKASAALDILRFKYSNDIADLQKAVPLLEKSVGSYRQLVQLTQGTYLYANSMQTQQRKIPMRGVNGTFKKWSEMIVPFENELKYFIGKIDSLQHLSAVTTVPVVALRNASVVLKDNLDFFRVDSGSKVYADSSAIILNFAKELKDLKGVKFSYQHQLKEGTEIHFSNTSPVKVLVGYYSFKKAAFAKETTFLKAPELETNASANDYGQAETKITNALVIKGLPPVNIHSYSFAAGNNTLKLAKGICLLLGFVEEEQTIRLYDAGLTEDGMMREIDWLFE